MTDQQIISLTAEALSYFQARARRDTRITMMDAEDLSMYVADVLTSGRDKITNPEHYARRLIHRTFVRHVSRHQPTAHPDGLEESGEVVEVGPWHWRLADEDALRLDAALLALRQAPALTRVAVEARLENVPYSEIAALLGSTEVAARNRVCKFYRMTREDYMKRTARYHAYKREVTKHTKASVERNGWANKPEWIDADHIVPKAFGFKHGIPAERIGSAENLQLMERNRNIEKGQSLTHEGRCLLRRWGYTDLADAMEMKADQLDEMRRVA